MRFCSSILILLVVKGEQNATHLTKLYEELQGTNPLLNVSQQLEENAHKPQCVKTSEEADRWFHTEFTNYPKKLSHVVFCLGGGQWFDDERIVEKALENQDIKEVILNNTLVGCSVPYQDGVWCPFCYFWEN